MEQGRKARVREPAGGLALAGTERLEAAAAAEDSARDWVWKERPRMKRRKKSRLKMTLINPLSKPVKDLYLTSLLGFVRYLNI